MFSMLRETLWILALALILCFGFFVLVGAFSPGEVAWLTATICGLIVAWIIHAIVATRNAPQGQRDLSSVRARERRGF